MKCCCRASALLAVLLLLLTAAFLPASKAEEMGTYQSGDYRYTLDADGMAEITAYGGSESNVIVPGTLGGHGIHVRLWIAYDSLSKSTVYEKSIELTITSCQLYDTTPDYIKNNDFDGGSNMP